MRVSPKAKIEKVASKDLTRPVLCSAYLNVGADGTATLEATNSYTLVRIPVELDEGDEAGLVPVEAITTARKARTNTVACNGTAAVLDGPTFARPDGQFPDADRLMPAYPVRFTVGINAKLLYELAQAMGAEGVKLEYVGAGDDPDALKPVIVTPLNGTGIDGAVGIAMPIRVGSVVQMARTTVREMESYVMHARNAGIRAGVPLAQSWELDYASCYGGAAVSVNGGAGTLGEACMSSNRIPPSDFCRAMRILIDVLEDMPQVAAPSITEGGAA